MASIESSPKHLPMWLLFAYDDYYPTGGLNDLIGAFSTETDARAFMVSGWLQAENFQLVNTDEIRPGIERTYNAVVPDSPELMVTLRAASGGNWPVARD
jgi:hypothetical protein